MVIEDLPGGSPRPACQALQGEMRIALAMSGAIALVLYESGVAHEVHAFATGKGTYAKAIELSGVRPIVDILTGASAGGINSVFLANCFANGADFEDFTDIWIETAGVDQLRYSGDEEPQGVLNIESLRKRMAEIFVSHVANRDPDSDEKADRDDLKVRLCRTDLRGYCVTTLDAAGHRIDMQNRSDVVAYDADTFRDPKKIDDVVDAAAATSAFPIAFSPVYDRRWYVDGGLWNNQPIDLAVEAIADKPAFGRTHRCVLFVDPDPSRLGGELDPTLSLAERAKLLAAEAERERENVPVAAEALAFMAFFGVKGNMLPALESILDYNRRSEIYQQVIGIPSLVENLPQIAADLTAERDGTTRYDRLSLLDRVRIENVLFDNDPKLLQAWHEVRRRTGAASDAVVDAAKLALDSIGDADLQRRAIRREIRDLNAWISDGKTHADRYSDLDSPDKVRRAKKELYRKLGILNRILYAPLPAEDDSISNTLSYRRHRRERVSRFWEASQTILSAAMSAIATPGELDAPTLALLKDWKADGVTVPTLGKVEDIDRIRYVLASVSDLDDKRRIDLIRISPNDTYNLDLIGVKLSERGSAAPLKLAGEGLGHLVGFLEERWRRNDYVWGRLDSAEILLRTLMTYSHREALALGVPSEFSEEKYHEFLRQIRTEILQAEAFRYLPRDGEGTNPKTEIDPFLCGDPAVTGSANTVEENRKIVGYGQESIRDAVGEPQFADNVQYMLGVSARLFNRPGGQGFFVRALSAIIRTLVPLMKIGASVAGAIELKDRAAESVEHLISLLHRHSRRPHSVPALVGGRKVEVNLVVAPNSEVDESEAERLLVTWLARATAGTPPEFPTREDLETAMTGFTDATAAHFKIESWTAD